MIEMENHNNSIISEKRNEIQAKNFEKAKNALRVFSTQVPSSPNLPSVETEVGPFGWFDHSVTGSELNTVTSKVQSFLIATNQQQIRVIKEFEQVYQTFEALDKEYIQGLIKGVEAAETASNQAMQAAIEAYQATEKAKQNAVDINSLIESQKQIIDKLIEFKKRIEDIPHIDNVSAMWGDIENLKIQVESLRESINQNGVKELMSIVSAQELIINNLVIFKEQFESIPHIRDFKIAWDEIHNHSDQLLTINDALANIEATTNARFVAQSQQISKQAQDLVSLIEKNATDHSERLASANHKQDDINKEIAIHFDKIRREMNMNEIAINERFGEQQIWFKKKLRIAYVVAGVFSAITMIHVASAWGII